jgi:hypothetical protein
VPSAVVVVLLPVAVTTRACASDQNLLNLIVDAMLELGRGRVPIPDTGSLRRDLVEYGAAIVASNASPDVEAIVRAVVAIGQSERTVADAGRRFSSTRLDLAGQIVERAIARGELPPDTDGDLAVEAIVAAIYFRLLMSGERLDTDSSKRWPVS